MASLVLDPREFRMLESLRLSPRRSFRGAIRGERLSKRKGISIEFADYREYTEGDDLRHLDWNVLARLDTPVMRTYQDEEDLLVYLYVDASPSMVYGEPTKLDWAKRMACAIGWVGLTGGDAILPRIIGPRRAPMATLRGRASFPRLTGFVESIQEPDSVDSVSASLRMLLRSNAKPGLLVLLSDGLDQELPPLLTSLGARGFEVAFLQILSDIELDPDLEGDLRLVDSEGGEPHEITANRDTLAEYRRRLAEHNAALSAATLQGQGRYELVNAADSLETVIGQRLKRQGWFA